jgi:hypothetical protein
MEKNEMRETDHILHIMNKSSTLITNGDPKRVCGQVYFYKKMQAGRGVSSPPKRTQKRPDTKNKENKERQIEKKKGHTDQVRQVPAKVLTESRENEDKKIKEKKPQNISKVGYTIRI